ncbi:cell division control protein 14, SIN component-domain-containing protein [Piptocephalis cylindrospora]|uniref:Cell division control protein 14, SIN component-domain-containing protein n=1 Tax=Piptocephalis cylindrospora TaxID=1907219 RepID=A0A4V1IYP5_9FUNG|nr:cell division control protein 14, SIN component-domain-containing protein [Piptocephalis cylindrospora]|eukprot:RKP15279.1 cell division control protein 14, SIN component-domain-containing protein [Piptocephalis cylindrospora]
MSHPQRLSISSVTSSSSTSSSCSSTATYAPDPTSAPSSTSSYAPDPSSTPSYASGSSSTTTYTPGPSSTTTYTPGSSATTTPTGKDPYLQQASPRSELPPQLQLVLQLDKLVSSFSFRRERAHRGILRLLTNHAAIWPQVERAAGVSTLPLLLDSLHRWHSPMVHEQGGAWEEGREELYQALVLLQGLCLAHPASRHVFSQPAHLQLFLSLLLTPFQNVLVACLELLTSLLADAPEVVQVLHSLQGLSPLVRVLKRKDLSEEALIACLEALWVYLVPDSSSQAHGRPSREARREGGERRKRLNALVGPDFVDGLLKAMPLGKMVALTASPPQTTSQYKSSVP